jgi:hypothetical protein
MPRFYGGIRRSAAYEPLDEVQRQRNNREHKRNDGEDCEPNAGEREQWRPRGAGALGLGGEVVWRSFGSRAPI